MNKVVTLCLLNLVAKGYSNIIRGNTLSSGIFVSHVANRFIVITAYSYIARFDLKKVGCAPGN